MDNRYLIDYYKNYNEDGRLTESRHGQVEYLTTRKYIDAFAKKTDRLLEIGAGTGRYIRYLFVHGNCVRTSGTWDLRNQRSIAGRIFSSIKL